MRSTQLYLSDEIKVKKRKLNFSKKKIKKVEPLQLFTHNAFISDWVILQNIAFYYILGTTKYKYLYTNIYQYNEDNFIS